MMQSLAFCTLPKKWLSIIFERGDPMHLLPVPNLLIRMNLFFAQVQADFRTDEVRIAKILSRLVQRTEGETIWAWRKSKTVVGVSWQYEILHYKSFCNIFKMSSAQHCGEESLISSQFISLFFLNHVSCLFA